MTKATYDQTTHDQIMTKSWPIFSWSLHMMGLQCANRTFKRTRSLSSSVSLRASEPLKLSSCNLWRIHCTTRSCMITMIAWNSYCSPCHILPANMLKGITNRVQNKEEQMGSLGCFWALGPFWPLCEDTKHMLPMCSLFCICLLYIVFSFRFCVVLCSCHSHSISSSIVLL